MDIVGTWECNERITYFLFRGDFPTRSCIMEEFQRHLDGYDSRMFKQQASEFNDDLWIAVTFTNKNARKSLRPISNESHSNILHDLNNRLNEIEVIGTCSKTDYECSGHFWIQKQNSYEAVLLLFFFFFFAPMVRSISRLCNYKAE